MKKYKEITLRLLANRVFDELIEIEKDIKYLKEKNILDAFLVKFRKNNKFIDIGAFKGLNLIEKPFTSFRRIGKNIFPKNDIILHYLRNYQENDELKKDTKTFLNQVAQSLTNEEKMILSKNEEFSFLSQEINKPEEQIPLDAMKKNHFDSQKNFSLDVETSLKLDDDKKKSSFDAEKK